MPFEHSWLRVKTRAIEALMLDNAVQLRIRPAARQVIQTLPIALILLDFPPVHRRLLHFHFTIRILRSFGAIFTTSL
jgi:hypothetical protein